MTVTKEVDTILEFSEIVNSTIRIVKHIPCGFPAGYFPLDVDNEKIHMAIAEHLKICPSKRTNL